MNLDLTTVAKLVVWDHSGRGKPKPMLPNDTPLEVLEFVKAHRAAVIWHAQNRYAEAPQFNLTPLSVVKGCAERQAARVMAYARAQGPEVTNWLEHNGNDLRACLALVQWQLMEQKDPVAFVVDLE